MQFVRNYQKIFLMKQFFFLLCLAAIMFSCTRNPLKVNVSDVSADVKIRHLDADLMKLKQDQLASEIPVLKHSYGEFFDIFTYRMISIGGTEQEEFAELLYSFISDSLNRELVQNVAANIDTIKLRKELVQAFKYYKHYFPVKDIPTIYTCISGFNQSVVTAENLIGISLDKYLGYDSRYYKELGLPVYKRRNMHPEKIVTDMMYAWAVTEWPKADNANNLLSQMIHEGKMQYFIDAMLPEMPDSLKIGFTKNQLDYCNKNEAAMWTFLAEHKLLYSTDRMSVKRFIDDGPYTSAFTDQSPARTGAWLGWQVVRSYMKQNKDVKLADLMNNPDFQSILNQSGYQP
ncbi:MAG TPA: hypothetical protein DHV48_14395 [Prolixibacteraceae bacterium]|nr:hypothetical protein [Prolixibacteraceae bacterium]